MKTIHLSHNTEHTLLHKCPQCNKVFHRPNRLSAHISQGKCLTENQVVCSFCAKRFKTQEKLSIHLFKHNCDKQFSCEYCAESFKSMKQMNCHINLVHKNQ